MVGRKRRAGGYHVPNVYYFTRSCIVLVVIGHTLSAACHHLIFMFTESEYARLVQGAARISVSDEHSAEPGLPPGRAAV